jgi:WD40 repeat protein
MFEYSEHNLRTSFPCVILVLLAACNVPTLRAQEDKPAADGTWISSVAWMGDSEIVGSKSQGLLLQPALVVKVQSSALTEMETLGEAESSVWKVLVLDSRVLGADYKGGVHIFGGGEPGTIDCEARWIRAMAPAPAEGEVLAGTEDGKLLLLSVDDRQELKRVDAHEAAIFDIAISPDAQSVVTAAGDGKIRFFSWPELELKGEMSRGTEAIWSVLYSADGSHLVSGGADRRIQLWDTAKRQSVCTIATTGDWITDLVALPESSVVVASCMDGKLVIADYQALTRVAVEDAAESAIWSMELGPDGTQLAIGTRKHGFGLVPVGDWISQAEAIAEERSQERPPTPKKQAADAETSAE